jgi:hypothetical protein
MSVVFISYRRKDSGGHAGRLHADLVRRYGRDDVFMDIDSLEGGVEFREQIHRTLDASDIALVLIGEAWTAPTGDGEASRRIDREDDLVRREVAAALKHEEVAVVPVLVEGAKLPSAEELPEDLATLRELHVCQLRNGDWHADVRRISRAIDASNRSSGASRLMQRLRRHPRRVAAALGLIALLAVLAVAIFPLGGDDDNGGSGGSGGPVGDSCENLTIPPDARAELADAASNPMPPVEGTVYYGACGSDHYAMATFPDGSDGVFIQTGLHWDDLGPISAEKCARIPPELLEAWKRQEGC